MPHALQTQLWPATRNLIKQSAKSLPLEHPFPRRSIHQSFAARASDKPKDAGGTNSSAPFDGPFAIDVEEFKKFLEQHRVNTGGPQPQPKEKDETNTDAPESTEPQPDNLKSAFHGSAVRRRQRARPVRADKPQQTQAPQWFVERNIHLNGDFSRYYKRRKIIRPNSNDDKQPDKRDEFSDYYVIEHKETRMVTEILSQKQRRESATDEARKAYDATVANEAECQFASPSPAISENIVEELPENAKYCINFYTLEEINNTIRGLLRPRSDPQTYNPISTVPSSHLIIQYPSDDGEIFLDKTVELVAGSQCCDLVVLDAQDIAELILAADLGEEISNEARMLGFEVYSGKNDQSFWGPGTESDHYDEAEEGEDSMSRENNPMGTPVVIGQPIKINLSDLMQPARNFSSSRSNWGPGRGAPFMSALFGDGHGKSRPGTEQHIFSKIVNMILSSPPLKRGDSKTVPTYTPSEEKHTEEASVAEAATLSKFKVQETGTLIHVPALKLIQNTLIGKQFLSELFEQVERRRSAGERVIIVGTEASSEITSGIQGKIDNIRHPDEYREPATTILLTPAQKMQGKTAMFQDRLHRFAAINYRHLSGTVKAKCQSLPWPFIDHHKESFLKELEDTLGLPLKYWNSVWSSPFVYRMASIIWARLEIYPDEKRLCGYAFHVMGHSDQLKLEWVKKFHPNPIRELRTSKSGSRTKEEERANNFRSGLNKYEKALYSGVIEPSKIKVTFNDVHVPIQTIEAIHTLTTLSLIRPEAFQYGVLASDRLPGLMLYGPPGTGKTLIAKAVAKESGATVLSVSSAQLNNMYVGEGEKNVQALFSLAKKLSPCVVFLDEADAMFSSRSHGGRRVSHRELLNQFLTEWDGMSNDAGGAFIMVATNRPMDIDDAVLRRLPRRILIDLPTETDRLEILKIHLREEQLADDVGLADLAKRTPFYSGSDLKNTAVAAALECVREENELAKNYVGEQPYKYDEKRTLKAKHFEKALDEISASISEDMSSLRDIKKFDEQYGDNRGKKRKSGKWGFSTAAEANKVLDTVKVRS